MVETTKFMGGRGVGRVSTLVAPVATLVGLGESCPLPQCPCLCPVPSPMVVQEWVLELGCVLLQANWIETFVVP